MGAQQTLDDIVPGLFIILGFHFYIPAVMWVEPADAEV